MKFAARRCRVYDPGALSMMGRAFDQALKGLPEQSRANPHIRRQLALSIIGLFDEGETHSLRISSLALAIVTSPSQAREISAALWKRSTVLAS